MYGVCPAVRKRALVLVLRDARRDALDLKGAELLRGHRIERERVELPSRGLRLRAPSVASLQVMWGGLATTAAESRVGAREGGS